ncbi:hypothetical protein ID855_20820 [Xenorhabdus sp. ZM]|nr:hypothetical protein [Xenorhabdus sp. ZM]
MPNEDPYQGQTLLDINGLLDQDRLFSAIFALLQRHASLRTGFIYESVEQPTAIVIDIENTQGFWQTYDLSNLTNEAADTRIIEIMANDIEQRFNLSEPPLIRFALIRRSAKRHHLLVTDHHIILDGWSMSTLWEELFTLYRDNRIQLPKPATYKDYLTWLSEKNHEEAIRVWRSYLSGVDRPTLIAPGREVHHIIPQTISVFVPEQLKQALMRTVLRLGLTLNSLMQIAWGMLLCHLTGRDDVLFGIAAKTYTK